MRPLVIILIIILLFGGIGTLPDWGYHHYGYYPAGGIGTLLLILLILALCGVI